MGMGTWAGSRTGKDSERDRDEDKDRDKDTDRDMDKDKDVRDSLKAMSQQRQRNDKTLSFCRYRQLHVYCAVWFQNLLCIFSAQNSRSTMPTSPIISMPYVLQVGIQKDTTHYCQQCELVGASLSEPNTSNCTAHVCVCLLACLLACGHIL